MTKVKKDFHATFMYRDHSGQLETRHMDISANSMTADVKAAKDIATSNQWRLRGTYAGAYTDGSQ